MEITLNVNVRAPELVKLLEQTLGRNAPLPPVKEAVAKKVADENAAAAVSEAVSSARGTIDDGLPKPPRKGRGAAPAAVAPAVPAPAGDDPAAWDDARKEKETAAVREKLSLYSGKFGMPAVRKLLEDFNCDRVTALDKNRFEEFKERIMAELTKAADPMA